MTIHGLHHSFFAFSFTLNKGGDCPLHAEGQISEDWEFARGRGTVLIFTNFPGGLVTMRREGRGLGDAAFAAPGGLQRVANGFYDLGPPPCGGQHNFGEEPTCGEEFEVNSDLRLQYLKERLVARVELLPGLPVVPRDDERVRRFLPVLPDLSERAAEQVLVGE